MRCPCFEVTYSSGGCNERALVHQGACGRLLPLAHLNIAKLPDNAPVGYHKLPAETGMPTESRHTEVGMSMHASTGMSYAHLRL